MAQARVREVMNSPGWEIIISDILGMLEKSQEAALLAAADSSKGVDEVRLEAGRYEGVRRVVDHLEKMKRNAHNKSTDSN